MHAAPDILARVVMALRVAVVVAYAIIGAWGAGASWCVIQHRATREDYFWSSMLFVTVGLFIFQYRAITGLWSPGTDTWSAVALSSFLLAAAALFYARSFAAAQEHRRAVLICHLLLLGGVIVAGLLS